MSAQSDIDGEGRPADAAAVPKDSGPASAIVYATGAPAAVIVLARLLGRITARDVSPTASRNGHQQHGTIDQRFLITWIVGAAIAAAVFYLTQ